MPDQQPAAIPWPPRRVLVRLNPDLTDSPLRRALHDAGLAAPFGNDTPTPPTTSEN